MKLLNVSLNSLVNYSLFEISPKIYAVRVVNSYERAMLFVRAQEFYESPFSQVRGKTFCMFEFMNHYRTRYEKEDFTYTSDWAGYNIPGSTLEKCMNSLLEDPDKATPYDRIMSTILGRIREHQPTGKFYVLGVDSVDSWIMKHEFAHALYYTDSKYKKTMLELIDKLSPEIREKIKKALIEAGYHTQMVDDETQAYLSTGMDNSIPGLLKIKGIKTIAKEFGKVFKLYSNGKF